MRKLYTAFAIAAAVTLGGCATLQPSAIGDAITSVITTGKIPSITAEIDAKVNHVISQVQDVTTKACGFLPLASTVASIVATFTGTNPIQQTVESVAQSICAAVTRRGAVRGGQIVAKVRGVPVRGQFVR